MDELRLALLVVGVVVVAAVYLTTRRKDAAELHNSAADTRIEPSLDGTDASDLVGKGVAVWGSVIRVIAESLDYWHRKGVVHGDLKPSNILLDRRGST